MQLTQPRDRFNNRCIGLETISIISSHLSYRMMTLQVHTNRSQKPLRCLTHQAMVNCTITSKARRYVNLNYRLQARLKGSQGRF